MLQVCNFHLGRDFLSDRKDEAKQTSAGYRIQATVKKQGGRLTAGRGWGGGRERERESE